MKVLLGVTGGVAGKLTPKLVKKLTECGCEVKVVATEKSFYFWNEDDVTTEVLRDNDEWVGENYTANMPIAHIQLREWADVMAMVPLTANTLAKLASGMADNLLTCVARAWDITKPLVIAPAMNTMMWTHPATLEHIGKLNNWYRLRVVEPVSKTLACGDKGVGALADLDDIVEAIIKFDS